MSLTKVEKTVLSLLSALLLIGIWTVHIALSSRTETFVLVRTGCENGYLKEIETKLNNKYIVNINNASMVDLIRLPGIGKKTADKLIKYREKIGGFSGKYDLLMVEGIGENKYDRIKDLIRF